MRRFIKGDAAIPVPVTLRRTARTLRAQLLRTGGTGAMLTRAAVCGHPASPDGGARPVRTRRLAEALQTHSPAIARGSTVATEQEHAAFHGAASLWCFVMVSDEFSSEANQFSPQLRG